MDVSSVERDLSNLLSSWQLLDDKYYELQDELEKVEAEKKKLTEEGHSLLENLTYDEADAVDFNLLPDNWE